MQSGVLQRVKRAQIQKKRLLEREVHWIQKEFQDFHTVADIELYNAEAVARFELGIYWI